MTIFISIAAYCDKFLPRTVQRAIETAKYPDQLHFGIVDQDTPDTSPPFPSGISNGRLSYVRIDSIAARGPCWARAIAMSFYDNEDWFFQIDSHIDFSPNWDEKMINAGTQGGSKSVISSYPHPFTVEHNVPVYQTITTGALAHRVKMGSQFTDGKATLPFEAYPINTDSVVRGFHVGAGCLFAPGSFAEVFPYDPHYYFHGEEQAVAIRLFTHGWDIWHMPGLPIYHLYNTMIPNAPPRTLHWDKDQDENRTNKWWQLEKRSQQRLFDLVSNKVESAYGLGYVRSLELYAELSGIDYVHRTIDARAYRPQLQNVVA